MAAKEIENYDKMKCLFESHNLGGVGKDEINAYNDYIANNIDDNDGNYDDIERIKNTNNNDNNTNNINNNNSEFENRRSSNEFKNTKIDSTQTHDTQYTSLITEVETIRGSDQPTLRYNNSHDWEIKMLLLPESPPDTPRF